jgi:protein-S-isoprenylcysteine O-methyltransferase Ste14
MRVVDTIIGSGWIAFWIYWLAAATRTKPGHNRWGRFGALRIGVIVVVIVLVRIGLLRGHPATTDPWLLGIGVVIFAAGLAFAIWARTYLGRNWGMPMTEKEEPELITGGPYRMIRHPIYTGIILGMIGTCIAISLYGLIVVALVGGYFIYSATAEERIMTKRFPDRYPKYVRSSKMLIPVII